MDFGLSEEEEALTGLMAQILGGTCTLEHLTEVEAGEDRFDRELWTELAKADLLGIPLPGAVGGGGFGFLEACLLLEEQGRACASIPLYSTFAAALATAEMGTADLVQGLLPGVVAGESVLTVALVESLGDPRRPTLEARPAGDGWALTGTKTTVPAAHIADAMVVSATLAGNPALFVVALDADGIGLERQDTFNHEPTFRVDFDGTSVVSRLGSDHDDPVGWLVDRTTVAVCALAAGVADRGMRITADYTSERHQFERPIATFQAVGQRMADTFIDSEAIRLTMLQAATKLDRGETADPEVAVAKYWASYGGSRVGHAGLHVHGGIGIDLDYPIHRHFLWAKQLEFTLGSGNEQLAGLGRQLADRSR